MKYIIFKANWEILELYLEDTIIREFQNFFCSVNLMMLDNFIDGSNTC